MTTTPNIPIELTQPGPPAVLYAAAGDQYSRLAALSLYVGGQPYTPPAGTTCLIGWRRLDGKTLDYGVTTGTYDTIMEPDGSTHAAYSIDGNVVTVELAWQVCALAGKVALNIALVGADGSRLQTWELVCEVQDSAVTTANDPSLPSESATGAANRAETAARQAVQAANLLTAAADRAEAAADRAEAIAPEEGLVLSVNGMGGAVTLDAQAVGAVARPSSPAAGGLLAVDAIAPETGAVTTRTILASGGLETAGGRLQLTPANAQQLAAMADPWAPIVPALLPLAVKLALASAWASAAWTDTDRANIRSTLGAASATEMDQQLAALEARVKALELTGGGGSGAVDQPYSADFGTMSGLVYTGVWNQALQRLEF